VASLIFDAAGNLYGTALAGGLSSGCTLGGSLCGVVFKLAPNSDGSWTQSVLYSFKGSPSDGDKPAAALIFDGAGNLYGTTFGGGPSDQGTVFKLTPNADGTWTESVLFNFCPLANCASGSQPPSSLVFDQAGNLYGTSPRDGSSGFGTVFKLAPNSKGGWTESVLRSFNGGDGRSPNGVIFDAAGNLYGTTSAGGILSCNSPFGCGLVFKLTPNSTGGWKESVIHFFYVGANPNSNLTFDAAGNLYGTASANSGWVFKLAPQSGGGWAYSVLRQFYGEPAEDPAGNLVLDTAGNLYGVTPGCILPYTCAGLVYEVTP